MAAMRRQKVSKRKSAKTFNRQSGKTNAKNVKRGGSMRGGIRT